MNKRTPDKYRGWFYDGFFRISKPQRKESDLNEWKEWFKRKRIRCYTVKTPWGWILCREGKEVQSSEMAEEE